MRPPLCLLLCLLMSACCTKMDCVCFPVMLTIKVDREGFSSDELDSFKLVITDKQFNRQDSIKIFLTGDGTFDIYEEMLPSLSQIEPHNFLIRNTIRPSVDTISDITNIRRDSVFTCNSCFIAKEQPTRCENVTSRKLKLNGKNVDGYTVVIK